MSADTSPDPFSQPRLATTLDGGTETLMPINDAIEQALNKPVVNERIPIGRGRMVSVVGRVGAERVNLDVATAADVMCSELTQDEAKRLRDALDAFLGDRKAGAR